MSKVKKARKLRRPNIPMAVGPITAAGGGEEAAATTVRPVRAETVNFDYTHIKKDLTRIGILAASFILLLVGLSFAMPYIVK
ncbi:MAG TPA: hypothetical protein VI793_20100 [Anaerolineales bacterium]|nr:hypothetical protein [Anaerolineales bacterium]